MTIPRGRGNDRSAKKEINWTAAMTIRTFCERCNRDVSNEDFVEVTLRVNIEQAMREQRKMHRQPNRWDFCIECARDQLRLDLGEQE